MSSGLAVIALLSHMTLTAGPLSKATEELLGGRHWRLVTARGPIHLWRPAHFDRRTAGIVLYVHGYFTDLDTAWTEHRLPEQFADSGLNALFIAPEAPSGSADALSWASLPELLRVLRAARIAMPSGPFVAVGHSGAYRTIVPWLTWPRLKEVILLDGLYENEDDFELWLGKARFGRKRLILAAYETVIRSEAFCERFRFAVKRPSIPSEPSGFSKDDRRSRLLCLTSQYEHMALITEGKVIPLLLQLSPLKTLSSSRGKGR